MNRNCYRLVFNRQRNAWLAVAETVRGRGKRSTHRSPATAAAVLLGLAMALVGSALAGPSIPLPNALPVPSSGSRPFVFAGSVNGGQPSVTGNAMTITTPSRALGLNWASFNIGSDASLTFNQPDATSRVLNRIWSADPSVIMGRLNANGEVYLINQNGILFGNGAQVNVGGLLASALNLSDSMASQLLNSGLPSVRGDRLEFARDGTVAGFNTGFITLDAGAKVSTPSGGRVLLIAPKTAENLGLIEGGGGAEAILAAGGKVILTAPDDPNLRGLLVETKSFTGKDSLGNNVSLDGGATNKGTIDTGSGGVVTLAALAVNQKGMVNASKAVNLNGTTMLVSGTTETDRLTINQRGDKAEIDWVSGFNVGAGKTVEFVQQSTGAVAYNYVHDADRIAADGSILNVAGRSNIDGILKANGQLLLINEKGIDFGTNARVTASSFVASALGINPNIVATGLLMQGEVKARSFYLKKNPWVAATSADFDLTKTAALDAFRQATINVAPGATIETAESGYAILAGSRINQAGRIVTPRGQTLLAAGADVYLKPPYSQAVRGFSAEVNPLYVVQGEQATKDWVAISRASEANSITNSGSIEAALGNITLVGHEITQMGVMKASTSATANGSIRLLARDQVGIAGLPQQGEESVTITATRKVDVAKGEVVPYSAADPEKYQEQTFLSGTVGGKLVLAQGSRTAVELDGSNNKLVSADQTFLMSSIEASAAKIQIGGQLAARGGRVQFQSREIFDAGTSAFSGDPLAPEKTVSPPANVGIYVGDTARIDVAGATAQKSVSDLFIKVELRGDEFADNPVQRNGVLRGKTAWVDIRDKFSVANLKGYTDKVGQTVEEKSSVGGNISLRSTGSVIVKQSAELDLSGGRIDYAAGTVSESFAKILYGKSYRLNDAPATARYHRLSTVTRKLAAYSEGKSAGTLELVGHSLAVDGKLKATTSPGAKQRNVGDPASDRYAIPWGGKLIVKDAGQHYATVDDRNVASEADKMAAYTQAQMVFVRGAAHTATGLGSEDSAGPRLELSTGLVDAGFSRFDLRSDGRIDIPAEATLNLAAGGSFKADGRQIRVAGDIMTPGGSIDLSTRDMNGEVGAFPIGIDAKYSTLIVDDGASLSTAGRWVNDYRDGKLTSTTLATQGGRVSLNSAYDLDLHAGSAIDVSGGGRVNSKRKLETGKAGSIELKTGRYGEPGTDETLVSSLFADGQISGYGIGGGGTLDITSTKILVGENLNAVERTASAADRVSTGRHGANIDPTLFAQGGFQQFKLTSLFDLTVQDGTLVHPNPLTWNLAIPSNYQNQASGMNLADFATKVQLHPDLRSSPSAIYLTAGSDLTVGERALLAVDPQGTIKLSVSSGQLTVLGTLEAPAGNISLARTNRGQIYNLGLQSRSIYLGENSRLLAAGTLKLDAATRLALESGQAPDKRRDLKQYTGQVLDGGKVELDAGLGYLITRSGSKIDVSGSDETLNVASAVGRRLNSAAQQIGSSGGRVKLSSREGMFLDGEYRAGGGNGALGGVFSLRLADDGSGTGWVISSLPASMQTDRQLTLFQSNGGHPDQWPGAINAGHYLSGTSTLDPAIHNGQAKLDTAQLAAGDFGSWYLGSENKIRFDGNVGIAVNNQLRLDARVFSAASNAQVSMNAAAVQIGNFALNPDSLPMPTASLGSALATVTARDIGLTGSFAWSGFGTSNFISSGELHFDSIANFVPNRPGGRLFNGQMAATGTLNFLANRLSPATYSDFRVDLLADPSGHININRQAAGSTHPLLSAGGRLEFAANTIDHLGTVAAPLGEIVFTAPAGGGKVTLGEMSITSVSAERDTLLGFTDQSGRHWNFEASTWNNGDLAQSITRDIAAPSKRIRIDAADSVIKPGAKLELSAGSDAWAWEFSPGPGGKTDALLPSPGSEPAVFAVIPDRTGLFNALDNQAMAYYNVSSPIATKSSNGSVSYAYDFVPSLKAGDQIQLAANRSGLAEGIYTLLPARYALLPGAWLVTAKSLPYSAVTKARVQRDSSWLVSGSRLAANADGSSTAYSQQKLAFEIAAPAVVDTRASYNLTSASEFYFDNAGARLAGDAGQLTVIGRNSLLFDPSIVAMRQAEISAADGRKRAGEGMQLDIAADKLLISDGAAAPDPTWSVLDQDKLVALGATSLLLGGARSSDGAATKIDTIASQVLVQNNGVANRSKALIGPELMLSAQNEVKVAANSRIESVGKATTGRKVVLAGDGAFLRVAEGEQAGLSRSGVVPLNTGSLVVEAGATVSGKSVILDATRNDKTRNTLIDGTLLLGALQADGSRSGGYLTIGAGRINVVGDASTPSDGLTLDNIDLARFALADQLRLTSYTTVDLYGNATLGTADLKELVIGAAGIAGHGSGTSNISARSVVFDNPNPDPKNTTFENAGLGNGILNVTAGTLTFDNNVDVDNSGVSVMRGKETRGFAMRGYAQVNLAASGNLRFAGKGVTAIDNAADNGLTGADKVIYGGNGATTALSIDAGRVVTLGTADHLLIASGKTDIRGGSSGGSALGLGGSLEVRAKAIDVSGRIETPSGNLILTATGTGSSDNVTLKNNAVIAAEGSKMAFADTFAYAPGGQIKLTSAKGNVSIDTGAIVTLAADAGGGDAGTLSLAALAGSVSAAAGTLRATASTNDAYLSQGALKIDAGSVSLDGLVDAVTETLGDGTTRRHFGGQWDIRSRGTGVLSLTKTIAAENVTIAADNAGISVGSKGMIDASGAKGGSIELYSRNGDINLTGQLRAKAKERIDTTSNAGTRGQGGTVVLAADGSGKVYTATDSGIDVGVADGSLASGGKVSLRAGASASIANATDLNIQLAGSIVGASDVGAEIVSRFTGSSLIAGATTGTTLGLTSIKSTLNSLYSAGNMATLRGHLGFVSPSYHVRAGVDIGSTSTADFSIGATASDLDFSSLRFAGEAGVLTVRAQGNLKVNSSISDGFIQAKTGFSSYSATGRDAKISNSEVSWSYRLVAGSESTAANPVAVKAPAAAGNIEIASGKLVRTGTGDITLAAQGDVKLLDKAVVFSAGRDDATPPVGFVAAFAPNDTSDTGQRSHFLRNGGDLNISAGGNITQVNTGALTDWMITYSSAYNNTQWWSRTASFQQGFASFGGGDINLSAGSDMTKVTAVIPTNGRVPGTDGVARPELAAINGGGDLSVKARGSINGGLFYAETGRMNLEAGNNIALNPVLALGNTATQVTAAGAIDLGNILNPMATSRNANLLKNSSGGTLGGTMNSSGSPEYRMRIGTYGEDSRLDITSVTGDLAINTDGISSNGVAPDRVSAVALNGNITARLTQMPGTSGQLDLLAAKSVIIDAVTQYDTPANRLPGIGNPVASGADADPLPNPVNSSRPLAASLVHSNSLWHADDTEPSRVIALDGDISGPGNRTSATAWFNEPVHVEASGKVRDLSLVAQHARDTDVTRVLANDAVSLPTGTGAYELNTIFQVNGPGRFEVLSGGGVDLGSAKGIITRGNLENPYLPEGGANILVVAGTTAPDYSGFLNYLKKNGLWLGGDTSAPALRSRFYTVLRDFGREAENGGGEASYEKGRSAILALFPSTQTNSASIDLFYSTIKTEQGGNIDLLAPVGSITVGLLAPDKETIKLKKASEQGLFTLRDGSIRAFVQDSFLVNQSRVFTLDGGDIMIWANRGIIDAGSGAKTVSSTPPPALIIRNGQIVLDTSNSVSGSGIGVLASRDDTPASDMDLFAPQGTIDAGDAGLRSTGNITLGAQTILNASNIQAAGTVSGAPAPAASAAPVAIPASPATSEKGDAQAASALASNRETPLGVLTVEVLESGEAAAEPASEKDEEKKKKR